MLFFQRLFGFVFKPKKLNDFTSIVNYWENRYEEGGNSGAGSYGSAALDKARFINLHLNEMNLASVIDFGCGDGNQLGLLNLSNRSYIGLDVSAQAINICESLFQGEKMTFKHVVSYEDLQIPFSDLALSMDVIYHLTEDQTYFNYLNKLFTSAKYVIIYSMDFEVPNWSGHSRPRKFSEDIRRLFPNTKLVTRISSTIPGEERMEYFLYQN